MGNNYYNDLRAFLDDLERRGKLYRWQRRVNKDTELMPLMRLQYRGLADESRRAFLYENVTDSHDRSYEIKVVTGVYGASRQIMALGMGCEDPLELPNKWHNAVAQPVRPVSINNAAVQEQICQGADLETNGIGRIPAPVEEPGFSGGVRVTGPFITRDLETGIRNVGMYSGHFLSENRMVAGIARIHDAMLYHYPGAVRRREPLPVAIVLGALPDINYVAAANLPHGVDELAVAGGLRGRPVEMVPCKTIPLEVPAEAEIVIEGEMSPEKMEPADPFSDYPGYVMAEKYVRPVIDVKAITFRKQAILPSILVGLPPSEANAISRTCREMMLFDYLRFSCNISEVLEVCCPEMGGGWNWWVVRIRKTHSAKPWQVLQAASSMGFANKVIIVVDEDIDPTNSDMVMWAMSFAMQPHRDTQIIMARSPLLDPSAESLMQKPEDRSFPPPQGCSGLLIDATRKGAYPAVGLPKQEFMEAAKKLWQEEDLPPLELKRPWYGYSLGSWTQEDDQAAARVTRGEYGAMGSKKNSF
ncbi:MAG: hypothetical protein GTO40_17965 [Deltaproteobacteria bacterium]|nr:hypothetical protein [Deltaproteobacteria bacterium]